MYYCNKCSTLDEEHDALSHRCPTFNEKHGEIQTASNKCKDGRDRAHYNEYMRQYMRKRRSKHESV